LDRFDLSVTVVAVAAITWMGVGIVVVSVEKT
jgi:hypothetical protein